MSGVSRRGALSLFGLALSAGAFLLFRPTDEKRALSTLKQLAAAVGSLPGDVEGTRRKRAAWALLRFTTEDVVLVAPETSNVEGRAAILDMMDMVEGLDLKISVDQADIRAKPTRVDATLLVTISMTAPSEERRQNRTVKAELVREEGDDFRVKRLSFSGISREQPEARP